MNVPTYAVDLLMAAKSVTSPQSNATAQDLADAIEKLAKSVSDFEAQMPVIDGNVQEGG